MQFHPISDIFNQVRVLSTTCPQPGKYICILYHLSDCALQSKESYLNWFIAGLFHLPEISSSILASLSHLILHLKMGWKNIALIRIKCKKERKYSSLIVLICSTASPIEIHILLTQFDCCLRYFSIVPSSSFYSCQPLLPRCSYPLSPI